MNMRAHFLARLCRPEDADDGDFWALGRLRRSYVIAKLRVVYSGRRLVIVDTVQPDAEQVHYLQHVNPSERMAFVSRDLKAINF